MPKPRTLTLEPVARETLEQMRDHHPKPSLRERAAALLKMADGQTAAEIARSGLLRQRDPDTLYRWLDGWQSLGLAGLYVRKGRGRKPAFSPSLPQRHSSQRRALGVGASGPAAVGG